MTKHRTDRTGREIAAGKAQINYRDLVINLSIIIGSDRGDLTLSIITLLTVSPSLG